MSLSSLSPPRVSVIIPAYNCAAFLGETLDSVRAQTLREWECIVVDDGSSDASAEVAQDYAERDSRIRLVSQPNAGVGVARNTGYAAGHANADYVIFLDSDDVWEPHALAVLVAALDARPDAVGAHGLAVNVGPQGEEMPGSHPHYMRERYGYRSALVPVPPDQVSTLDVLVTKYKMYPPGVVMVRRPLIARAGLWAPRQVLAGSEDLDMFGRVCLHGPFLLVDQVIARYRQHGGSMSAGNARGHWWRRQVILRRLIHSKDSTTEQARLVRNAARAWGWSRQAWCWQDCLKALRSRQWSAAGKDFARGGFFLAAHLVSDLDLRLHGVLRTVRRCS